ncbi:MAG: protein kinase [Planctomycetaceae bacterium]
MGTVWVAEQQEPVKRRVALKVIKPGMDTAQVLRRFEAERQALAMMDHSSIAKVFEAGTTAEGRPFFVMELVKGVPITKYCDELHLSVSERLALFVPVCQAIQHAHQKGIIHRDIKPSNVLIAIQDSKPVPKVIDFGVAKSLNQSLTEQSLYTEIGQIIGTLEYMSPEQAELSALDIDTRADVYALGVLLYELLTGTTPLDRKRLRTAAYTEMVRIIREDDPPKPSTRLTESKETLASMAAQRRTEPARLTREVCGELDWITMKCLEKDRMRRYETANGLARDVERYLANEPVEACPPRAGYRLRKFANRYRAALVTIAAFGVLLIAGVVVSAWLAVRAKTAERQAIMARDDKERARREAVSATEAEAEQHRKADLNAEIAQQQTKLAERHLYLAHMNLAQSGWEDSAINQTVSLLDLYRPAEGLASSAGDVRGFEWYYWDRCCHSDLLTLNAHSAAVTSVAVSPDGRRLASASADQTVKVSDAVTGQELLTLKGHSGTVWKVAFSPDGQRLASVSSDKTARVWDGVTGQELLTLEGHTSWALSVAFSPDGLRLASGDYEGTIKWWDAVSGNELFSQKGHYKQVWTVVFSSDGKQLASASFDPNIKIWDNSTGQELRTLIGHTKQVLGLAFHPDGMRLASSSYDMTLRLWDVASGRSLLTFSGHSHPVNSLAFSPDGTRLVSGGNDQMVKLWDAGTGEELSTLKGHTNGINSVAFSPNGLRVVSASHDHTVKVWDANSRQDSLLLKGHITQLTSVAFSADGNWLASAGGELTARIWDAALGLTVHILEGHTSGISSVAFSPDSKRLATASGDKTVKIWDATSGRNLITLTGSNVGLRSVAFSPDGNCVAASGANPANESPGEIFVWNANTGERVLTMNGHKFGIYSVAFSPDGKRLVSASSDGTIILWDAASGEELLSFNGHADVVFGVAFSPDSKWLASASRDSTVKIWDVTSGLEKLRLRGHAHAVTSVAFSPDGNRLATTSWDHTVKLWDPATGQESLTLKGCDDAMASVAFSPDGMRLASASWDHTVRFWDARPWTEELRRDQAALAVFRFLSDQPIHQVSIVQKIRDDQTISNDVRERAMGLAEDYMKREAWRWPAYLTAERKARNLLRNGSFETEGDNQDWTTSSWRKNAEAATIAEGLAHEGNRSGFVQAAIADDVFRSGCRRPAQYQLPPFRLGEDRRSHACRKNTHRGRKPVGAGRCK